MNDMDAFKELVKRSPDVELMSLDQLHGLVFWSGAALKWAKTQIDIAKELGGLNVQIDAWAEEGNAAADLNFRARQRRGRLAKETEQADTGGTKKETPGRGGGRTGKPPKWQRLGYKSALAMQDDEFLHANPKIVEDVKKQAKKTGDFPSVTAVKNEARAQRAEERATKYKERLKEKGAEQEQERAIAPFEVQQYLNKLMQIMNLLPAEPPREGWSDKLLSEAKGYANIIKNRLRRFFEDE